MFELLDGERDKEQREDPITVVEQLSVFVLMLAVAFGSVFAFISLGDGPYGMQYSEQGV